MIDEHKQQIKRRLLAGEWPSALAREYGCPLPTVWRMCDTVAFPFDDWMPLSDVPLPETAELTNYFWDGEGVRSARGRLCRVFDKEGYLVVNTQRPSGHRRSIFVHRIICAIHHGAPPKDKPNACHHNDIQHDNVPQNLYWGSQGDNMRDMHRNNDIDLAGDNNPRATMTNHLVVKYRRMWKDNPFELAAVADLLGVSRTRFAEALNGTTFKCVDAIESPCPKQIRPWTDGDVKIAMQDKPLKQLAELLGRSTRSIATKRWEMRRGN
jgi:hypothetical protein